MPVRERDKTKPQQLGHSVYSRFVGLSMCISRFSKDTKLQRIMRAKVKCCSIQELLIMYLEDVMQYALEKIPQERSPRVNVHCQQGI